MTDVPRRPVLAQPFTAAEAARAEKVMDRLGDEINDMSQMADRYLALGITLVLVTVSLVVQHEQWLLLAVLPAPGSILLWTWTNWGMEIRLRGGVRWAFEEALNADPEQRRLLFWESGIVREIAHSKQRSGPRALNLLSLAFAVGYTTYGWYRLTKSASTPVTVAAAVALFLLLVASVALVRVHRRAESDAFRLGYEYASRELGLSPRRAGH